MIDIHKRMVVNKTADAQLSILLVDSMGQATKTLNPKLPIMHLSSTLGPSSGLKLPAQA